MLFDVVVVVCLGMMCLLVSHSDVLCVCLFVNSICCFSLGLVFNVVVTICLSKVLYRVLICRCCCDWLFKQCFVSVMGSMSKVVMFACSGKVLC